MNCSFFVNKNDHYQLFLSFYVAQTPSFFIKDKFKKMILSQVISAPVVSGLVYIIKVISIDTNEFTLSR